MTVLPRGKQWIAHDGKRARLRRLRQMTRGLQISALHAERLARLANSRPASVDREHFRLILVNRAREVSDVASVSLDDALEELLDTCEMEVASDDQAVAS